MYGLAACGYEEMQIKAKKRKRIAVLFGGCSNEYGVSLQSAAAVIAAFNLRLYKPILLGISQDGEWYRYYGSVEKIANDTWCNAEDCHRALLSPSRVTKGLLEFCSDGVKSVRLDAALPVMHGKYGEDGTVQGLLALAGIPLIGCDALASALCMDKALAQTIAASMGIHTAKSQVFHRGEALAGLHLNYPLFVKPVCSGSSVGISFVREPGQLAAAMAEALRHDDRVIIEERVIGVEIGCAVMESADHRELLTGELDEIELQGDFFDFTEKYSLQSAAIHLPARIAEWQTAEIKHLAKRLFRALGCRGFARIDFFLTPSGEVYFNEVNTIPGFTAHSRFPKMMQQAGWEFADLVERILETAVII